MSLERVVAILTHSLVRSFALELAAYGSRRASLFRPLGSACEQKRPAAARELTPAAAAAAARDRSRRA